MIAFAITCAGIMIYCGLISLVYPLSKIADELNRLAHKTTKS